MIKIMFVCHGNICRSPMAEFIFKDIISESNNDYFVASSATSSEEIGNSLYYEAKKILDKHHIRYNERKAIKFTLSDYSNYDYIIVMDDNNLYNLSRIIGGDKINNKFSKVKKLLWFCVKNNNYINDVSDPWYTRDFEKAYQDIYRGCYALYQYLETKESK